MGERIDDYIYVITIWIQDFFFGEFLTLWDELFGRGLCSVSDLVVYMNIKLIMLNKEKTAHLNQPVY